jgi:hypothetical protein
MDAKSSFVVAARHGFVLALSTELSMSDRTNALATLALVAIEQEAKKSEGTSAEVLHCALHLMHRFCETGLAGELALKHLVKLCKDVDGNPDELRAAIVIMWRNHEDKTLE